MNRLLGEILKGEWLLDVSGQRSLHYSRIASGILLGDKLNPFSSQEKCIGSLLDANGKPIKLESQNPNQDIYGKVDMLGEILKYGDYCAWGADEIVAELDTLNDNPNVKGIILNIDSPGGAVGAYGPIQSFSQRKKKPIIVLADMACSLGYLTAITLGDKVFADNDFSARFGSIGVVCSFITPTEKYFEEKGIQVHEVYPEESSAKNKPFRLAKEGDYDLIKKEVLSPMAIKFQNKVREKRAGKLVEEGDVLKGATFTVEKAIKNGLIDGVADVKKAIQTIEILNHLNTFE